MISAAFIREMIGGGLDTVDIVQSLNWNHEDFELRSDVWREADIWNILAREDRHGKRGSSEDRSGREVSSPQGGVFPPDRSPVAPSFPQDAILADWGEEPDPVHVAEPGPRHPG